MYPKPPKVPGNPTNHHWSARNQGNIFVIDTKVKIIDWPKPNIMIPKLNLESKYRSDFFNHSSWTLFIKKLEKLTEINTISQRNVNILHLLIRSRFQGYHCKLGIAILAWRITWNYAYSLCNITFKSIVTESCSFKRGGGGLLQCYYIPKWLNT